MFDLKENINLLRVAESKRQTESSFNWSGPTKIFKTTKNKTSEFITNLDKVIRYFKFITFCELLKFLTKNFKAEEQELQNENEIDSHTDFDEDFEMEKQVKHWPDFLKLRLHERSYIGLKQYQTTE